MVNPAQIGWSSRLLTDVTVEALVFELPAKLASKALA